MGTVYLIGAGPGDPGLLTVRAADLLRRADIVVHGPEVGGRVLEQAHPDAELVPVGSGTASDARRLLDAAGRGQLVVRLMAGDPFLLGSGGEEALALHEAGIPFEVVPGLPPGVAVPAYAGIPLTIGGAAPRVVLLALHEDLEEGGREPDWAALTRAGATLVIESGMRRLARIAERLVEAGCPPETPVAAVTCGTVPRQRTAVGTLTNIAAQARREGVTGAVLVIIGETVALRERLNWFEARPLFGRRVVVTRARAQVSDFAAALEASGAEVIPFPTIQVAPPADPEPLRRAVREVRTYDWVVFTSVNGVDRFWQELEGAGLDARTFGHARVACVGPATVAALEVRGIRADVVPPSYMAEAVIAALADAEERSPAKRKGALPLGGARVLLPLAAGARSVLAEGLAALGAIVHQIEAYRSVPDLEGAQELRRQLDARDVDVITFTASSTIENFVAAVGADTGGAVVATIGPITAETARRYGLPVDVEAAEHTIPGLIRALLRHFGQEPGAVPGV